MWMSLIPVTGLSISPSKMYDGRIAAVVLKGLGGSTAALEEQRRRSCSPLQPACVGASSRCQRRQRPRNRQHTCQLCSQGAVSMFNHFNLLPLCTKSLRLSSRCWKSLHGDVKQLKQQFVSRPNAKLRK